MEEKKLELVKAKETRANDDEAGDILGQLHARGLLHISDTVLGHLGYSSLLALAASCQLYSRICQGSLAAQTRIQQEATWLKGKSTAKLLRDNPTEMVTCLAADSTTILYSLLGTGASVQLHDRDSLQLQACLVQATDFPASISALAVSSSLVVTAACERAIAEGSQDHAVYLWARAGDRGLLAKLRPHTEMIRALGLVEARGILLTASSDSTICVLNIQEPCRPRFLTRLCGHQGIPSSLAVDTGRAVTVSTRSELKVWSLASLSCSLSLTSPSPMLRVCLSWPLAATGGRASVLLWNLLQGVCLRSLEPPEDGILNVLAMDRDRLVSGDHRGRLAIWSVGDLLDGSTGRPHRVIRVAEDGGPAGVGHEHMSGLVMDGDSLITAGWAGRVLRWGFQGEQEE